jgi:hypothetical protein
MKVIKLLLLLIITLLLFSCSTTKILKFTQKSNEIVNTNSLTEFLAKNKKPKVVLRVKNSSINLTENEDNDYLYNAIENQLLRSGFIVRDRQLFNQITGNDKNNIDYKKLKEKSDTDIIIELTKLKTKILYETDKYYDKKNHEKTVSNFLYKSFGASVEFKIILINTNEFAGVYKFNYTPCVSGCVISLSTKELLKQRKKKLKEKGKGYEGVERDELEIFMKNATRKLVEAMRK